MSDAENNYKGKYEYLKEYIPSKKEQLALLINDSTKDALGESILAYIKDRFYNDGLVCTVSILSRRYYKSAKKFGGLHTILEQLVKNEKAFVLKNSLGVRLVVSDYVMDAFESEATDKGCPIYTVLNQYLEDKTYHTVY